MAKKKKKKNELVEQSKPLITIIIYLMMVLIVLLLLRDSNLNTTMWILISFIVGSILGLILNIFILSLFSLFFEK